jgi:hypothetical protein
MAERIVVSLKVPTESLSARQAERVRTMLDRAAAVHAEVLGLSPTEILLGFPSDGLESALRLIVSHQAPHQAPPETLEEGEVAFSAGIAQGEVSPLVAAGARGQPPFQWGMPLMVASALASATLPGQITVSEGVKAFRHGELLTLGSHSVRCMGTRLRGARLDVAQPLRREAAARLARLAPPPNLLGNEAPAQLVWPGSLSILRADPGLGGTRSLREIARAQEPARALFVSPSGSGLEPFGALRRAIARTDDVNPFLLELAPTVERLAMGEGVTLEEASRIVAAFLWPKSTSEQPGPLLVDDAAEVDEASLAACARALMSAERSFPFVIRLDATGVTPKACAELAPGPEAELAPLPRDEAEAFLAACLDTATDALVKKRWARLGGNTPLGVIEALSHGVASGDVVWADDVAHPRRRASGKGKVRPARQWISLRAMEVSPNARITLGLLSILGGEASVARIERVLSRVDMGVTSPRATLEELARARFVVEPKEGYVALPSRTHRDALSDLIEEPQKRALHREISDILENEEGRLARAEAAHHAAKAGDGARAAKLALSAARAASELGLEFAAVRLLTFARTQDPSVEAEARARVASSIPPRGPARAATEISSPVARLMVAPSPLPSPRSAESFAVDPSAAGLSVAELSRSVPPPSLTEDSGTSTLVTSGAPSAAFAPESQAPYTVPDSAVVSSGIDVVVGAPALERLSRPAPEPGPDSNPSDSEPPTLAREGLLPLAGGNVRDVELPADLAPPRIDASALPPPPQGEDKVLAERLTELAKEALLGADTASLERWVDSLGATGEHQALADRMRAMARLSRGEIGDALRVLKRARANLPKEASVLRCQTSLALGMALAVAGRSEEALLEGLDALSRARQANDQRGTGACLAFLAKLFASVDRGDDAARLRMSAPPPSPPPEHRTV